MARDCNIHLPVKLKKMRQYTIDQYYEMSDRFNKLSFSDKIKKLSENKDILCLASDGNHWEVHVKDELVQERLSDEERNFSITTEWGAFEMMVLIDLIGIENIGL